MFKVFALFSNGRTSEHVFDSLRDAVRCARNIEAGSFATCTIHRNVTR